jgi:hypothetical protein
MDTPAILEELRDICEDLIAADEGCRLRAVSDLGILIGRLTVQVEAERAWAEPDPDDAAEPAA